VISILLANQHDESAPFQSAFHPSQHLIHSHNWVNCILSPHSDNSCSELTRGLKAAAESQILEANDGTSYRRLYTLCFVIS